MKMVILAAKKNIKKPGPRCSKHIPHQLQSQTIVAERNWRERERINAVNVEYENIKRLLPLSDGTKRISRESILHFAMAYIRALERMLRRRQPEVTT